MRIHFLTYYSNLNEVKQIVGNKSQGRISKRVFHENKPRQMFQKRTFLNPRYAYVPVCIRE